MRGSPGARRCGSRTSRRAGARGSDLRASRLAADLSALAESKRERSPFYPQAGVGAVPLYRQAAACMIAAGDSRAASMLNQDADSLSRRVTDAFTVSRLRLERAIRSQ